MMNMNRIVAALVGAINSPTRSPALWPLAPVKYPSRELQPRLLPDGSISVRLALYGWEYKHRGPRPKTPPGLNLAAIQAVLSAALPDGIAVAAVENYGKYIMIQIKEDSL